MNTRLSRIGALTLAVATTAALGACSKGDRSGTSADTTAAGAAAPAAAPAPGAAVDTTAAGGAVGGTATKSSDWTDADIFAWLAAANSGEISAGRLAERKATNPDVKKFARQMVHDHTTMLNDGTALAKRLHVNPADSHRNDVTDLQKHNDDEMKDLRGKSGASFDKDYMDKQVDDHQQTVDKINDFIASTQTPQLKTMLQQALTKVQGHLQTAKNIQQNRLKS